MASAAASAAAPSSAAAAGAVSAGGGGASSDGGQSTRRQLAPPPSAKPQQLAQWNKVLSRRRSQLSRLDADELRVVHDLVLEEVGGGGGRSANRKGSGGSPPVGLPHPEPSTSTSTSTSTASSLTPSQHRENVEHALQHSFYGSVDRTLAADRRQSALGRVKRILAAIECGRVRRAKRRLREEEAKEREAKEREAKEKEAKEKEARDKREREAKEGASGGGGSSGGGEAAGQSKPASEPAAAAEAAAAAPSAAAEGTEAAAEGGDKMGLALSSASRGNDGNDGNDDDDSDDEIIVLDGPPTPVRKNDRPLPRVDRQQQQQQKQGQGQAQSQSQSQGQGGQKQEEQSAGEAAAAAVPRRPRRANTDPHRPKCPRILAIQPDTYSPTYSASLHPRPGVRVTFDAGYHPATGSFLDEIDLDDFRTRLERWDPYWDVIHDFTVSRTANDDGKRGDDNHELEWGRRTGAVMKYDYVQQRRGLPANVERYVPASAASVSVVDKHGGKDLAASLARRGWKEKQKKVVNWGKPPNIKSNARSYENGEVRCIVRMLPLYRTDKDRRKDRKKRADTHLWPKGTFVQVKGRPVALSQRKQQGHAPTEWKGMCHPLDVTALIQDIRGDSGPGCAAGTNTLEVVTRDDVPYGIQVAVCEYVGPDELFERLTDRNKGGGPPQRSITVLSYEEGLRTALRHVEGQMVVLDSDDDDQDGGGDGEGKQHDTVLTLSLLCPISKTPMVTPVRGRDCRHVQCFDLRTWLHSNATVSGGRWRCGVCEDFVSTSDLILDGLFGRMLERHAADVSGARDKVQLRPDGSWELMDANRLRYGSRKRGSGDLEGDGGAVPGPAKRGRSDGSGGGGPPPPEEIIEL